MAGIKITDLTALAAAEAADYLCIVDVSDTTSSPEGTTKKIEVGNFGVSGTWTPTFSTFSGAISAATLASATYSRVGNIVTCQIALSIDVDFSGSSTGQFFFTYPIATTSANNGGSLNSSDEVKQFNGAVRFNKIQMQSGDTSLISNSSYHAVFQYEIN